MQTKSTRENQRTMKTSELVRRFLPYFRPYRGMLALDLFCATLTTLCDLVLPNSLPLERYDDVATPYGSGFCVYSLVRPIQKPICDTKTTGDVLLSLARKLSIDLKFDNFQQVIKEKVASLAKVTRLFTVQSGVERKAIDVLFRSLRIKAPSPETPPSGAPQAEKKKADALAA